MPLGPTPFSHQPHQRQAHRRARPPSEASGLSRLGTLPLGSVCLRWVPTRSHEPRRRERILCHRFLRGADLSFHRADCTVYRRWWWWRGDLELLWPLSHAHFPKSAGARQRKGQIKVTRNVCVNASVLKFVHEANPRQQNPRVGCC